MVRLALVCKRFRQPCQRALFKNVHLVIFNPSIVSRFVNTLKDHPDTGLEGYVESIHLVLMISSKKAIGMFQQISEVLPNLHQLTSMTIKLLSWIEHNTLVHFSNTLAGTFPTGFKRLTFCSIMVSQAIGS